MSRRYEFLEGGAEVLEGDDLLDLGEYFDDGVTGPVALVLGNPWATAAVLVGTRESIATQLREYLTLLEA